MLSQILGAKTTSRLYQSLVVEQGVAAWAGSSYSALALDETRFRLYVQGLPETDMSDVEAALERVVAGRSQQPEHRRRVRGSQGEHDLTGEVFACAR